MASAVAVGLGVAATQHWQVLGPQKGWTSVGAENHANQRSESPQLAAIPKTHSVAPPTTTEPAVTVASAGLRAPEQTDAGRDIPPVILPGGVTLVLESAGRAGAVGYRVTGRSRDHRFAVGDLITAVGGNAVEASAAGSELLLAALMNPQTKVEVTR